MLVFVKIPTHYLISEHLLMDGVSLISNEQTNAI